MAEEESEHANKFMEYQNKRGGTVVLMDIPVCFQEPFKTNGKSKISFSPYFSIETKSTKLEFTS